METLRLNEGTTKPTTGSVAEDLTGCTLVLMIALATGTVTKSVEITSTAAGYSEWQIDWGSASLVAGRWDAQFVLTDQSGVADVSDTFILDVQGRIA